MENTFKDHPDVVIDAVEKIGPMLDAEGMDEEHIADGIAEVKNRLSDI